MKKVLLLSPPYLVDYMRNARCDFVSLSNTQWFPLWLGYCGAYLEKKGYEVKLLDAPSYGYDHDAAERIILDFKPDLLVVYSGRLSEDNDVEFADRIVSKLGNKGVFVGPFVSVNPNGVLNKSKQIRLAVQGEFEYPVGEILDGKRPEDVLNLYWKDGDEIRHNPLRPALTGEQLDDMPFVTDFFSRHLDFKYYKTPSEYHPFIDVMTGRGCQWGRCTYCLWVHTFITGSVYNTRSIGNVVEEFKFVKEHIPQIRSIMIQDDTFTEDRAAQFCEALLKVGVKIPWSCYARGNMNYDALVLMKKAGCRNLHVGYESANTDILKGIKKGLTKDRMTTFTMDAKRAGLRIHGDFAIGFPGETEDSVRETVEWACYLRPHTAQFQLMIPFPGTPFYGELQSKGWLKQGFPNYPKLSTEEMEALAKKAYRKFYISLPFMMQALAHPHEIIFSKLKTYYKAVPSIFWKKYVR